MEKHVEKLIEVAATVGDSGDAMRYSQAACNAANAMCALATAKNQAAGNAVAQPLRVQSVAADQRAG